jgi:transcriptional regulator with GAF, ATPase, and Fis domain
VFLDEVGELTPDSQMKLLRALQQRTVQRLGSGRETPFDARVIAATNADLTLAPQRGRFRQDLYYRLKVYELRIPPLRCRGAADLRRLVDAVGRIRSGKGNSSGRRPASLTGGSSRCPATTGALVSGLEASREIAPCSAHARSRANPR